jgi:NTE family protein
MAANLPALLPGPTIALSGGGFRSTLFQVGVIVRLNELRLLRTLKCISSVSGGSIASGFLGAQWNQLGFDADGFATQLATRFTSPLVAFCSKSIDASSVLGGLANPFKHIGDELVGSLDSHLFNGKTLQDLPDSTAGSAPRFVFNATSMQTGVRFWFSREDAGDYRIGFTKNPKIPLARAVASSSAFPPFFAPLPVDISGLQFQACVNPQGQAISDLLTDASLHQTAECVDGGTYDNMALEAVWNTYDTVWVSDAGSPLEVSHDVPRDWLREMLRVIDLMMRADEAERRRDLIAKFKTAQAGAAGVRGTYWGLTTTIAHYGAAGALPCLPTNTQLLASIPTRLAGFTEVQQQKLVNWGYALADAAIRSHIQVPPGAPGPQWPYPNNALG